MFRINILKRKKYTTYILDKNNRFFKDCFHQYFQEVKSFEDHFTQKELNKIYKLRRKHEMSNRKSKIKNKPHKYHL